MPSSRAVKYNQILLISQKKKQKQKQKTKTKTKTKQQQQQKTGSFSQESVRLFGFLVSFPL